MYNQYSMDSENTGTGLVLSNALLIVFIDGGGMVEWLALLIVNAINMPLNFLPNKFWANG